MKIANNCVVSIHYTLTNDAGKELDSSAGDKPLSYLHGAANIVSGLEGALEGCVAGDEFNVTVQPEQGYGNINPDLIQSVPRSAFDTVEDLQVGMQLQATDSKGEVHRIMVREVGEEIVAVDGNHPLAGQILHFAVKVAGVREATEEEIEHGHAH